MKIGNIYVQREVCNAMSAKKRLLAELLANVSKFVARDRLQEVAQGVSDWARALRTLRQEGWDIETITGPKGGYILHSAIQGEGVERSPISTRLRAAILNRDNYICCMCGYGAADGRKLQVDHKTPVDLGGTNDEDNLWTTCEDCNQGKKNLFDDSRLADITQVMKLSSAEKRLSAYFELYPNEAHDVYTLAAIGKGRDWTRAVRKVREGGLDIQYDAKSQTYTNVT